MTQVSDQQVAAMSLADVQYHFKSMLLKHIVFDEDEDNIVFNEAGYFSLYTRWLNEILKENDSMAVIFANLIKMYTDSGHAAAFVIKHMQQLTKAVKLNDELDLSEGLVVANLTSAELTAWVGEIDLDDLYYDVEKDTVVSHNEDDAILLTYWDARGPEHLVWMLNSALRTREAIEVQYLDFMDSVGMGLDDTVVDLGAKFDNAISHVAV